MRTLLISLLLVCGSAFAEGEGEGEIELNLEAMTSIMGEASKLDSDSNKAIIFGCFSLNRRARKFGSGASFQLRQARQTALRSCRRASGNLGYFCRRPQCMRLNY
jgi:hypothetical protein